MSSNKTFDDALIATYVPEAADMTYEDALALANERDGIAADEFANSVLNEKLVDFDQRVKRDMRGWKKEYTQTYSDEELVILRMMGVRI